MAIKQRVIRSRSSTIRRVPTRTTRNGTSSSTPLRTLTTIQREQQSDQDYLNFLSSSANNFLGTISNINNADAEASRFIAQNIDSVEPKFRNNFIALVNKATQTVKQSQNTAISNLNTYKAQLQKDYDYYRDRAREYRKLGRDDSKWRARYKSVITMLSETDAIINRLRNGEVLDQNSVKDYIKQSGKAREQKVTYQIAKKTAIAKGTSINSYINDRTLLRRVESIEAIKQKFSVSDSEAKKIQKEINNNINKRTEALDEVKENVILGASYSDKELADAGFTTQDIKETKMVRQLESKRQESLLKSFDDVKPSLPNIKQYSTISAQIINSIPKNKVSPIVVQTPQQKLFNRLSERDKQLVTSYQAIKTYRSEVPSEANLKEIKEQHRILSGAKDYAEDIKNAKTRAEVIDVINSASIITPEEEQQVRYLKGLSDSDIRKLLISNKDVKINNALKSLNKYLLADSKNTTARQTQLKYVVKRKLDDMFKEGARTPPSVVFKPVKALTLWAKLKYVEDLKKKGKSLTPTEYNEVIASLDDVTGIKKIKADLKKRANQKVGFIGQMRFYVDVLKFIGNITLGTAKSVIKFIEFAVNTIKLIPKGATKIKNWYSKSAKDLVRESIIMLSIVINPMSKVNKNRLFEDTKKNFAGLQAGADAVKWAYKNPSLIVIGAGVLVGAGLLSLRKLSTERPDKLISEVLSFYVLGQIGEAVKYTAQLTKATFSPFVIRNVKVFSQEPTIRGTAEALQKLEGTRINLFSASPDSVKKLFKGFNLSKKAEELIIKDMLKNPTKYIGSNLKIKALDVIAKTKPQKEIIQFMKLKKTGIITGSSSLKLQLQKFRKIGDFDIIAKNSEKFAKELVDYLNSKTLWGKLWKKKRFTTEKLKNIDGVWKIYDGKKAIADIDSYKLVNEDFFNRLGRKLASKDFITIQGIKVLKVEPQLVKKFKISRDLTKAYREGKELGDVKLILKKIKQNLKKKDYKQVKKLLDTEKGVLRVKGDIRKMGLDRQYGWAKKYLPELNLRFGYTRKEEFAIRSRLKKIGFTDTAIDKNRLLYAPDDLYFAPDTVYSHFLIRNGKVPSDSTIIFAKDIKVSAYSKNLQALLKKHQMGLLSQRQIGSLRQKLSAFRKANPDKVFVGEKALIDRFGENEILAPVYTRLFPKKTLIKREIWIPELRKFIVAQEVVIGKPPLSVLKRLTNAFKGKVKGKPFTQLKKEIGEWAKNNLDDVTQRGKAFIKGSKENVKFIKKQTALIDDEIKTIQKLKIPAKRKAELIKNLRRTKKRIQIKNIAGRRTAISNIVRRSISAVRKRSRISARAVKRSVRPVKRTIRKTKRVTKRITKRVPVTRRITVRPRPKTRVPVRPRSVVRPRTRVPVRPRARVPIRPRPRPPIRKEPTRPIKKIIVPDIRLSWDSKLRKGENFIVNGRVRVKGKTRLIRLKTTPNRAYKKMSNLIDNTTSRSFDLVIIGKQFKKDISKPNLIKFRAKKSKGSKVLKLVEKSKYAIDTRGEKRGLTIAKALQKRKPTRKKRKVNKKVKHKKKRK